MGKLSQPANKDIHPPGDVSLLVWGMWLSTRVRKVPPAYNESKYIICAIYSTAFATCLNIFTG